MTDSALPRPTTRLVRPVVVLLFLCSGASGLVFETLWMRLLTTTFGATTFAVSTVLTVFMGGLALGGWIAGTVADRLRRESTALIVYGALELLVAAYALGFPAVLEQVHHLNAWIWARYNPEPEVFAILRFLVSGVVLIVPTTAMGATLPVLSRYYARRESGLGRDVGTLYSVNILGAMTGTFLAGFVLMPLLGLAATNRFACGVNLVLCIAAASLGLWLRGREPQEGGLPKEGEGPDANEAVRRPWSRSVWVALVAVAVSGLVAMVYQQIWTRILALIVGSSVYAFAMILVTFLMGLALGGAIYARLLAHRSGQMARLGLIHLMVATMVILGIFYMDRLPELFLALARLSEVSTGSIFFLQFLMCALVVLLPTVFMGMVFPATIAICEKEMTGVARTVGCVYSINTVGAIVGGFVGGFVMLPYVGAQRSLMLMILVNLALAVVFTGLAPLGRRQRLVRVSAIGLFLVPALLSAGARWEPARMTSGVFRLTQHLHAGHADMCPEEGDSLTPFFAKGPGKQHRRRAEDLVGHRPDLEVPCLEPLGSTLLHYREGVVATVSTWQFIFDGLEPTTCWERLIVQVNGKVDASAKGAFRKSRRESCSSFVGRPEAIRPVAISGSGDMETQVLSGLLGTLLLPPGHHARRALVVGWGSGISVGVLARTGIGRVDAVELEPEVLRGTRAFERYNMNATSATNVRILKADGRNVLLARRDVFDVIVSEPSNPWMTGAASLFTREYFELVRRRMHPEGIFIQWLQLYEISQENVLSIIATLRAVFPYVTIFHSRQAEVDLLLVATRKPLTSDAPTLAERLALPAVRGPLSEVGIRNLGDLTARHLTSASAVDRLVRGAPLNTDDNARIEFSAPKDLINASRHSAARILKLLKGDGPSPGWRAAGAGESLLAQRVDAELRLGNRAEAERLLAELQEGPAKASRLRLLEWTGEAPAWDSVAAEALAALPGGTHLASRWKGHSTPAAREEMLRRIAAGRADGPHLRALGVLLAPTRQRRLALLFLTAGLTAGGGTEATERVRAWLLWNMGLHDVAVRISQNINAFP